MISTYRCIAASHQPKSAMFVVSWTLNGTDGPPGDPKGRG